MFGEIKPGSLIDRSGYWNNSGCVGDDLYINFGFEALAIHVEDGIMSFKKMFSKGFSFFRRGYVLVLDVTIAGSFAEPWGDFTDFSVRIWV